MHLLRYLFILLPCCLSTVLTFAQNRNDTGRSAHDTLRAAPARTRALPVQPTRRDTLPNTVTTPVRVTAPVRRDTPPAASTPARAGQPVRRDSSQNRRFDASQDRTQLPANQPVNDTSFNISVDTIPATPAFTPAQLDSIGAVRRADSVKTRQFLLNRIGRIQEIIRSNRQWPFFAAPEYRAVEEKHAEDKDALFYFLCGLVLYFAILKLAFGKYLGNLFTLFFRVTMRQQQIREQLLQTPLPSLMLNILFAISAGMYLNLILFYYKLNPVQSFWVSFYYCVALICLLYLGKLLILKTMGWIFNVSNATNTYLFIVFLVNKMIGMFLLPFLFLLAFPHPALISGMVTLSFILVIALLMYRFIISYRPVRSEINVGRLHFIIYLCAFEIAPLLLIYKVLLNFVVSHH
ncbi:MAG: DUF4271 domain-containing protein [Chitinophagaceae bacterium]|nr:MAG: DUF4271 domain-containing protein [Chitinophagaceae bacterium]